MQQQPELTFVAPIVPEFTADFADNDETIGVRWNDEKRCYENKIKFEHYCAACGKGFRCTRGFIYEECVCLKGYSPKATCTNPEHPKCCLFTFCSDECFGTLDSTKPMMGQDNVKAWINSFCK